MIWGLKEDSGFDWNGMFIYLLGKAFGFIEEFPDRGSKSGCRFGYWWGILGCVPLFDYDGGWSWGRYSTFLCDFIGRDYVGMACLGFFNCGIYYESSGCSFFWVDCGGGIDFFRSVGKEEDDTCWGSTKEGF